MCSINNLESKSTILYKTIPHIGSSKLVHEKKEISGFNYSKFLSSLFFLSPFAATSAPVGIPALFPLVPSSVEEGVRRSGSCGGVVLSCTDKLNRRTVLVRPVSKQDTFSHFSGFFSPVRIRLLPILSDSATPPPSVL